LDKYLPVEPLHELLSAPPTMLLLLPDEDAMEGAGAGILGCGWAAGLGRFVGFLGALDPTDIALILNVSGTASSLVFPYLSFPAAVVSDLEPTE